MNTQGLEREEQDWIERLKDLKQNHLFEDWDDDKVNEKKAFLRDIAKVEESYPGGIDSYIENAKKLLAENKAGKNPFAGMQPEQPDVVDLSTFSEDFLHYEQVGLEQAKKLVFVLVAGGLGERLGYNGIKVDIPFELLSETTYLQYYCETILALESRFTEEVNIPFVIMVSQDTEAGTLKSLEDNQYFGLKKSQVHILKQALVPGVVDNDGRLAKSSTYEMLWKPHGHGDIHMLLHQSGLAKRFYDEGRSHLLFIQDTNAQAMNVFLPALGVSVEKNFAMNSMAVPRVPGEAVGALVKLKGREKELTINVEYNQLDGLLRDTVSPEGDVAGENGYSLFPGNINILLIALEPYVPVLERSNGIIAEFINPKYADEAKTTFKKPTRLETLMQDLPKLFNTEKVGVTVFDRTYCFSADKNNLEDAAKKHQSGGVAECACSAESDFYQAMRAKLNFAGVEMDEGKEELFAGVPMKGGAKVFLHPSFALSLSELKERFKKVKLSANSSLVIKGRALVMENVEVKNSAALFVDTRKGEAVALQDKSFDNKGCHFVALSESEANDTQTPEYLKIRQYKMKFEEIEGLP